MRAMLARKIRPCFVTLAAVACLSLPAFSAKGSELRVEPGIAISEEYDDNIFLTKRDRTDDFITSIIPSLHLTYAAPFWDWDILYGYNYRVFAKNTVSSSDASNHTVTVTNHNRIIDEFFFVDLKEDYNRVSLDLTRDFTKESYFVNLTDRNIFTVNPYFQLRPLTRTIVRIGYMYTDTQYRDPLGIDKTDNSGYAEIKWEPSAKSEITVSGRYTQDTNQIQNYNRTDAFAGWKYVYADKSSFSVMAGYSWFDYVFFGKTGQFVGSVSLIHSFQKLAVTIEAGESYVEDPTRALRREDRVLAGVTTEVGRTKLGLGAGYREYRNAETQHLEDSRYDASGTVTYELTPRAKFILDLMWERVEDNRARTTTDLILAGGRLEYLTTEKSTLALDYRFSNSTSPEAPYSDYDNNRIMILAKIFF